MKKGIYTIIGTFVFIMITVGIGIGLIGYGYMLAGVEENIDSSMTKYETARDVRDRVMYCYAMNGRIIRDKLTSSCDVPHGYQLEVVEYGRCPGELLKAENTETFDERFVFSVPIVSEDGITVCPGRLFVYV